MVTPREPPGDEWAHRLADFVRELNGLTGEAAVVAAILAGAIEMFSDIKHVSVVVRSRASRRTVGSTSPLAAAADDLQSELREGPCVDDADRSDWIRSGDVAHDRRWPRWGPAAAELDVRSLLSLRLVYRATTFGALNVYCDRPGAFVDTAEVALARAFAAHAASALGSSRLVAGLETALETRHDIGMAQGILLAAYGLDEERSFAALTRISSTTNTKLRDIAAEVVRTGALPEADGNGERRKPPS